MVSGQSVFQEFETLFWRIAHPEQVKIWRRDHSGVNHGFEVDDLFPVRAAIDNYHNLLGQLLRLRKGENLEEFVERAKSAGKNHQGLGQIGEPEFTHEEVMKLEIERRRDVGIRILLEGQVDVEANRFSSSLVGAKIRGFHN